jgi:hypothetical protein
MEWFPNDFMFRLAKKEYEDLRYHFGTSRWEVADTRPTYSRISHDRQRILLGNKRLEEVRNAGALPLLWYHHPDVLQ